MRFLVALAAALILAAVGGSGYRSAIATRADSESLASQSASSVSAGTINWGQPVFTDNFNGTTLSNAWSIYNDPQVAPPAPKRTKSSVVVRNGTLQLIGHYQKPYGYVSGGISYNTNQLYGRWVVRFRADAGAGYAPVVLLWPQGPWPEDGEIDLAEIGNPQRHGAGEFLHLGALKHFTGRHIPASVDFTKWHTMAVVWLPDQITFWLDGKQLWTVRRASGAANYIPSTPFHLALQNDEGCDVGCKPNKDTSKQVTMFVDWVKIYAAPGSTAPPTRQGPGSQGVRGVAYSPDGSYLATSDSGHIYQWALPDYKLSATLTIHRTSA